MYVDPSKIADPFLSMKVVARAFKWTPLRVDPVKTAADYKLIELFDHQLPLNNVSRKAVENGADPNRARILHVSVANGCRAEFVVLRARMLILRIGMVIHRFTLLLE
jgi:hypothetical protein